MRGSLISLPTAAAGFIDKKSKRVGTVRKQAEIAASGLTPIAFMLDIVRNEKLDLPLRLQAARDVAPYTAPRLAVIDSTVRAEVTTTALTEEQRVERARKAIAEAFAERTPLVVEGEYKVIAGKANREDKGSG
jgi:hypothetical protein